MLEMPADLDAPWELRRFKVGDRVKVNAGPECPEYDRYPHHLVENDHIGKVVKVFNMGWETHAGHYYEVKYEDRIPMGKLGMDGLEIHIYCGWFAAIELEPLDADRA